eukprot:c13007_g1_i2.p1 GENE.c13007_g1_i2~~c13007_g1_i2.p1  ORF type:complete len:308 (+),score=81.74 c13007_g1_i2:23-925(+)
MSNKQDSMDRYYLGSQGIGPMLPLQALADRKLIMEQEHIVLVMVGLPARGKSYLARKIELFLRWKNIRARLFNVGKHRRAAANGRQQDASFFSSSNESGKSVRELIAMEVVSEMLEWLDEGGGVAILDATNSTNERRRNVETVCREHDSRVRVVFIEVICNDKAILEENMRQKIQNSPDFAGKNFDEALQDLKKRIAYYAEVYESVVDESVSFIKLFDMQSKVYANKVYGYMARGLLPFVMCLHVHPRPIYLVRSGSTGHMTHPEHGTSHLSPADTLNEQGTEFARCLADFLKDRHSEVM